MDGKVPRIDLWIMHTDTIDPQAYQRLLARLSPRERSVLERLAKPADRRLHAAAHALKRHALSARFDRAPLEWDFVENANGKPRLSNAADGTDPRFNLTHTQGLVAVAVSNGLDLGLDAEWHDPTHATLDTAQAFAHPAELRAFDPESASFVRDFYRLWTRKEALAKATGLGLALDVRTLIFDDEIQSWHLAEWEEGPEHCIALVTEAKTDAPEILLHRISEREIP